MEEPQLFGSETPLSFYQIGSCLKHAQDCLVIRRNVSLDGQPILSALRKSKIIFSFTRLVSTHPSLFPPPCSSASSFSPGFFPIIWLRIPRLHPPARDVDGTLGRYLHMDFED